MHEVAHAAARLYPSLLMNDLRGIERCVAAFDARLAAIATLSPEDQQALASEADRYAGSCGAQCSAWNRTFQATCHQHNPDVNLDATLPLPSAGTGSKAGIRERPYFERLGARRHS